MPMTTAPTKPAAHLAVSYAVCIAAATLLVAAVQAATHNALSVVEGGALTTVLAEAAVMALRATGQVDVPDAPATVDVAALAQELGPLVAPVVEAAAGKGAGAEIAKALAPVASPATAATTA